MTKPKKKPKSQMRKTTKPRKKAGKPAKTMKSNIRALKEQVRKSVSRGDGHVTGTGSKALESRQLQIEIANLEAKAEDSGNSVQQPSSPATDQKLRKKIDSLRRKLSAAPTKAANSRTAASKNAASKKARPRRTVAK